MLSVECGIEQVRRFLVLATRSKDAKLCSEEFVHRAKNEHGSIRVEAEFKEVIKDSEDDTGVLLVKVDGVKRLDYESKSGMMHLTWTPCKLNPVLGRLSGYASPRAVIYRGRLHTHPLPVKEKKEVSRHLNAHATVSHKQC